MRTIILTTFFTLMAIAVYAQTFSTYEEFRSLSRANSEVFRRMVSTKGFERSSTTEFLNKKTKELLIKNNKNEYSLVFVTSSPNKVDNVVNSFKKRGFKYITSFEKKNLFKGYGDLIFSTNYYNGDSWVLEGKIEAYEDKSYLYFIGFYNL